MCPADHSEAFCMVDSGVADHDNGSGIRKVDSGVFDQENGSGVGVDVCVRSSCVVVSFISCLCVQGSASMISRPLVSIAGDGPGGLSSETGECSSFNVLSDLNDCNVFLCFSITSNAPTRMRARGTPMPTPIPINTLVENLALEVATVLLLPLPSESGCASSVVTGEIVRARVPIWSFSTCSFRKTIALPPAIVKLFRWQFVG